MINKIPAFIASYFLLGCSFLAQAQAPKPRPIEVSMIPILDMAYTYYNFAPGYSKDDFIRTTGFKARRDINFGLGARVSYNAILTSIYDIFTYLCFMSIPVQLTLAESAQELKKLFSKASVHLRPRIKMLQCVSQGIHANSDLAAKTGAGIGSIIRWKQTYLSGGIGALAGDARGGDFRSNFSAAQKEQLRLRLSDPTNAFTSYGKVREWISTELGVEMSYTAVYAFLRRNFGTKLKVGRKSHVKKDELAAAVFKNAT